MKAFWTDNGKEMLKFMLYAIAYFAAKYFEARNSPKSIRLRMTISKNARLYQELQNILEKEFSVEMKRKIIAKVESDLNALMYVPEVSRWNDFKIINVLQGVLTGLPYLLAFEFFALNNRWGYASALGTVFFVSLLATHLSQKRKEKE